VVSIDNVIASMNEAKTHCARSWPSVKWLLGPGMATLTMVEDTMDAIGPIITVSSTSHWQRSPWRVCNLSQGRGYQQGKAAAGWPVQFRLASGVRCSASRMHRHSIADAATYWRDYGGVKKFIG
jgi:hypothetical protein